MNKNLFILIFLLLPTYGMALELLLKFDGSGNAFVDSSGRNHAVTVVGNVSHSSATSVSGNSAFFSGGGYLEIQHSSDFLFAPGADYTIDFWVNTSAQQRMHSMSFGRSSSDNIDFDFNDTDGGGNAFWLYHRSGGSNAIRYGNPGDLADGQWHHIAAVRKNGVITHYLDGVATGGTLGLSGELGSDVIKIGASASTNFLWQGHIDEVRVVSGEALFANNFDPTQQLVAAVPEPTTLALLLFALAVLGYRRAVRL